MELKVPEIEYVMSENPLGFRFQKYRKSINFYCQSPWWQIFDQFLIGYERKSDRYQVIEISPSL